MKRLVLVISAMVLAVVGHVSAHEIGKTQVFVVGVAGGSYDVTITVDPDALLTRLQIAATGEVTPARDNADRDRRIAALGETFMRNVTLAFDGVPASSRFEFRPAPPADDISKAQASEVHLLGAMPKGAKTVTFGDRLVGGTYAVVVPGADGTPQTTWVEAGETSAPISLAPVHARSVAVEYLALGFTHILPKGLDHILFVVGLFLLSTRWRSVLAQVSAFTIAHSITLGLTMYGVVSLPSRIVEPMIALSIAYVAIENTLTTELKSWRVALVFAFGLLHGMGFAGVLSDLGLPRGNFLAALLTFNLGVEAGQLTVVAIAFAGVYAWRRNAVTYRRFIVQPASMAIAAMGLYWTVERLL
jgi:hydrogenase/urease accessory protein HupE